MRKARTLKDASKIFWGKVSIKSKKECWEWIGKQKPGKWNYGLFWIDGTYQRAHRVAYRLHYGKEVPHDLFVCHHCDNPPCCNPYHLFLGTQKDNLIDMVKKGRAPTPRTCIGLFGQDHPAHVLTASEVRAIRNLYSSGNHFQRKLARRFGVSQGTICNVLRGKHYPDPSFVPVLFSRRWRKRLN